jgi:HSP20 family molecular chaperone IbpA
MIKIVLILSTILSTAFAQKTHDQILEDFLESRRQMMEKMMKAFDEDDFFKNDFQTFPKQDASIKIEQITEKDGKQYIVITPQSKDINFDLDVTDSEVKVKGTVKVEEKNTDNQSQSFSSYNSQFSQIFPIPLDKKALSPKQEGESIKIELVPLKDERTPVSKPKNDKII